MAGITFELTDTDALQRFRDVATAIVDVRGIFDGETLRLVERKGGEFGIHRLDVEEVLEELAGIACHEADDHPMEGGSGHLLLPGKEVVKDLAGRLIWSRNADLGNGVVSRTLAGELVKAMNDRAYAGSTDWRIPNLADFEVLFRSAGLVSPEEEHGDRLLARAGFSGIYPAWYWTGSPFEGTDYAMIVDAASGRSGYGNSANRYRLWAVSSLN